MKKFFLAIVFSMICDLGWGAWYPEPGAVFCTPGYMWDGIYNSKNCVVCPDNTYQDSDLWDMANCNPCPAGTGMVSSNPADHDSIDDCKTLLIPCAPGYYLPANGTSCAQCPRNSYCVGGEFDATTADVGIMPCPNNTYSPAGSDSSDDCGRILHIGEYILYLRTAKLTTPSLNVQIGNTVYYGDMFPA